MVALFQSKTKHAMARHKRARNLFLSGVVHDSRHMSPYPLYVELAKGSRKWGADGNEFIDFYGGHGSLLFCRSQPTLIIAAALFGNLSGGRLSSVGRAAD
tara:strand:+ start:5342 stop:5641 length:300 start_codon:yes stop_codon:yes gene_type:complete